MFFGTFSFGVKPKECVKHHSKSLHPDSIFFFLNYLLTWFFAVSAQVCQSQKSFISTSFVAEFSFSLAQTTFLVAFSSAETTFLVAETKIVKM